jgi:dUTP pyrophosphatase
MRIKIIDFGFSNPPYRAHANDAGADVYATKDVSLCPGQTYAMPLGFGLELPDGYAGFIFPRSGLSKKGIVCELPPIDSGYRGEIHAIISNIGRDSYDIKEGDRIGQLVITSVILASFSTENIKQRGNGAFASTGK